MKSTGQGRFRGVPFGVYKEQRSRGGRRVVRREYPQHEHDCADDLGKKLPEHTFTLSLIGDDAQAQRVRLTQALNAPGPGELLLGREIFKRETCDKCGSTWDKLDLSGTGQDN